MRRIAPIPSYEKPRWFASQRAAKSALSLSTSNSSASVEPDPNPTCAIGSTFFSSLGSTSEFSGRRCLPMLVASPSDFHRPETDFSRSTAPLVDSSW